MTERPPRLPGHPVRGSRTGRPIMALFDLIGRRWNLRIIWELHQADQPLTFRELRVACGDISSSVLTRRLHELAEAKLARHTGAGYTLTSTGQTLVGSLQPILRWAEQWSHELEAEASPPVPDPHPPGSRR
jgi:DNA-binding HxlR family transcriptional regulator